VADRAKKGIISEQFEDKIIIEEPETEVLLKTRAYCVGKRMSGVLKVMKPQGASASLLGYFLSTGAVDPVVEKSVVGGCRCVRVTWCLVEIRA
jgi:hypothetical protein